MTKDFIKQLLEEDIHQANEEMERAKISLENAEEAMVEFETKVNNRREKKRQLENLYNELYGEESK